MVHTVISVQGVTWDDLSWLLTQPFKRNNMGLGTGWSVGRFREIQGHRPAQWIPSSSVQDVAQAEMFGPGNPLDMIYNVGLITHRPFST